MVLPTAKTLRTELLPRPADVVTDVKVRSVPEAAAVGAVTMQTVKAAIRPRVINRVRTGPSEVSGDHRRDMTCRGRETARCMFEQGLVTVNRISVASHKVVW